MSVTKTARPIRAIAEIERQLRGSTAPMDISVDIRGDSVRIGYDTYEPKSSTRGRLRAHIAREIVESESWEIVSIHDRLSSYDDEDGFPVVGDMIDAKRSDS